MSTDDHDLVVYSDYVCPFCYLGKASLETYLAGADDPPSVEWHVYDLRGGKRRSDGSIDHDADDGKDEAYFEQVRENVERLKESYGVEMDLDLSREIDSWNAQLAALSVKRTRPESFETFHDAVFDALWQEGEDIGDPEVLAEVAASVGMEKSVVREAIEDDDLEDDLRRRFERARRAGITGIPTFVYDEQVARGAVPPDQLRRLVEGAYTVGGNG